MATLLGVAAALLSGCGGTPSAGPSPVAVAPPPGTVAQAAAPITLPVGLDPVYVRAIVFIDAAGRPKRWEGGPFRHCLAPEVDRAVLDPILAEMTAITGIPRTETGPCNVEWVADYGRADHTYTSLSGTETAIYTARVFLYHRAAGAARHEAGHVLGLVHSPRPDDLMNATPRVDTFSRDELAVLAWMYGR